VSIKNLPPTACVKQVRSFFGNASFYCRFIKDFSKLAKPLINLLAKDVPFHFSKECHMAFTKLKEALASATILPFELMCDASNYIVGVVLG